MKMLLSICFTLLLVICNAQDDGAVSLQERLRSNIFLKVEASSDDVFVGEPISVSYKLYTAVASESSIVKRPSTIGFEVNDISGTDDAMPARENVDGVVFDVHTILKMRVTPTKAGRLTLGSLTLRNRIKLVDANGNEDPILEGVQEGYTLNNGFYTLMVSSAALQVLVTALPATTQQPSEFDGLVGDFKMDVQTDKRIYAPGEKGQLVISITGNGDYNKVQQPKINWPEGIEVFAAKIDANTNENEGSYKSFTIPFVVNKTGKYNIPSVQFSYFDLTANQYKTLTNIPVEFSVISEPAVATTTSAERTPAGKGFKKNIVLVIGVFAILLFLLLLLIWLKKRKSKPEVLDKKIIFLEPETSINTDVTMDDALQKARTNLHQSGNAFFLSLKEVVAIFLEKKFKTPKNANQDIIFNSLKENNVSAQQQAEITKLLDDINRGIYSAGYANEDRTLLLNRVQNIIAAF